MLGPLAAEFLVAAEGDLPASARRALDSQIDLDLVPAEGLTIYHNPAALPIASVVSGESFERAAGSDDLLAVASAFRARESRLRRVVDGWVGSADQPGLALVSIEFDPDLRAQGGLGGVREAFGWASAFDSRAGAVSIRWSDPGRTMQMSILGVLWLAVLWLTRRPASRER
jgi:hypothetical protein